MPTPIIMPKFEMTQEDGTIALWLKEEGSAVKKGEPVLEVETDKVTMEVEAPADGILRGIQAREGELIPIGVPIAYLVAPDEAWPPAAVEDDESETADDATLAAVTKPGADGVQEPAQEEPRATPVARRMAREHGVDLAIFAENVETRITKNDIRTYLDNSEPGVLGGIRAVPAARRLARIEGIDLQRVEGSGPGGRIQSDDVRRAAEAVKKEPAEAVSGLERRVKGRVVPLNHVRQTIARRMTSSFQDMPQFTLSVDVSMERALDIIGDLNDANEDEATRVTVTAFLVQACAYALRRHPEVNASYDGDRIIEWDDINVGIAVAIEDGLIVPVIRDAGTMRSRAISRKLSDLVRRARDRQLRTADLAEGTFTLSNLGMFSVDHFTALINPPQAAILAVGRIRKEAVVSEDDRVVIQRQANLTLTADHRVLDGAVAARFLTTLKQAIERPGVLVG